MAEPIAITGLAAWTPFGRGLDALFDGLASGARAWHRVTRFPVDDPFYPTPNAMALDPTPESGLRGDEVPGVATDWALHHALTTALDAFADAGLSPRLSYRPTRVAFVAGSSHGTNHGLLSWLADRQAGGEGDAARMLDSATALGRRVAAQVGAAGPNLVLNTACSSGVNAIGQAVGLLDDGLVDCVIAGGTDTFSILSFAGFCSLKAVDPQGCRPFDLERAGMSLGDGSAFCVLERAETAARRGARVRALITGYACAGEAHHATAPDPEGRGALQVMSGALASDPRPSELGHVSAHGTGTPANDEAELRAIEGLIRRFDLPGPVDVASIKSQLGHSLGAAGAIQVAAAVGCLERGFVPGTPTLRQPLAHDPRLRLSPATVQRQVSLILCNSFGFAGSVASVALRSPGSQP